MLLLLFLLSPGFSLLVMPSVETTFLEFMHKYNRTYEGEEFQRRLSVFVQNLQEIERLNTLEGEDTFGIGKFADMTSDEFKKRLGFRRNLTSARDRNLTVRVPGILELPSSFDWRDKGAVTDVKDQGDCGSCWAFSTIEEVESTWFLNGNKMQVFSPQQVVSCDEQDDGCDGGDTLSAYKYIAKVGGLTTEKDYPYTSGDTGKTGRCKRSKIDIVGGRVKSKSWATAPCEEGKCNHQNEDVLAKNLVDQGPVSVCLNAEKWQHYKRGVMSGKSCGGHSASDLDHCVQLVGFADDYWMVRNSWNTDWGIEGYIHLKMGSNTCGIADEATITDFK